MTAHTAYLHIANKTVTVIKTGDAQPAGTVSIGTFNHDPVTSSVGDAPGVSHVMYEHVRDLLYKRSAANPANAGFWPNNLTDMASFTIVIDDFVNLVSMVIAPATVNLSAGTPTAQLSVTPTPANASNPAVATWVSSDPTKATVSATGLVTRVAAGTTTITATSVDGAKTATRTVTVS